MPKTNASPTETALQAQREAIAALQPKARREVMEAAKALRVAADFFGVEVAVEALRLVTLENELEAEF